MSFCGYDPKELKKLEGEEREFELAATKLELGMNFQRAETSYLTKR